MNDLISRQAAIDAIERLEIPEDMCVFEILSHIELEIGTLPSAQLEPIKINIDDFNKEDLERFKKELGNTLITVLPAQPEIIRCKDCKFYFPMNRETKTGICNLIMHQNFGDNWFCAGAERRPDESDRKRRCPMADGMRKEELHE